MTEGNQVNLGVKKQNVEIESPQIQKQLNRMESEVVMDLTKLNSETESQPKIVI